MTGMEWGDDCPQTGTVSRGGDVPGLLGIGEGVGYACKAAESRMASYSLSPCPWPQEWPPDPSHKSLTRAEAGGALSGSSANRGCCKQPLRKAQEKQKGLGKE